MTDTTFERGLPASVDAERSILGAILLDNRAFHEASARLSSSDFALDSHQRIFARIAELMAQNRAVDIVTLAEQLSRRKEVEVIGGVAYLASLTEGLPRRLSIAEYVRIVYDKSTLRKLINIGSRSVTEASDQAEDASTILSRFRNEIDVLASHAAGGGLELAGDYLRANFETPDDLMAAPLKNPGLPSGFDEFDSVTCGFQRGDLIIVAARPSMGKTAWAANVADYTAVRLGKKVAFFSLEMTKQALLDRMICARARVNLHAFRGGRLTPEDKSYFRTAMEDIQDGRGLFIDARKRPTVSYVRSQASWLKEREGLDLIIADHLGLFSPEDLPKRYNREQEVALMSQGLKAVAADLNVPVVLLCQLSRENTKRSDKRPILSDLRESGSIEQDADVVAFLHRESYYDKTDKDLAGKGEVIIAKQRQGPTDTVELAYEAPHCRWGNVNDFKDSAEFAYRYNN